MSGPPALTGAAISKLMDAILDEMIGKVDALDATGRLIGTFPDMMVVRAAVMRADRASATP